MATLLCRSCSSMAELCPPNDECYCYCICRHCIHRGLWDAKLNNVRVCDLRLHAQRTSGIETAGLPDAQGRVASCE